MVKITDCVCKQRSLFFYLSGPSEGAGSAHGITGGGVTAAGGSGIAAIVTGFAFCTVVILGVVGGFRGLDHTGGGSGRCFGSRSGCLSGRGQGGHGGGLGRLCGAGIIAAAAPGHQGEGKDQRKCTNQDFSHFQYLQSTWFRSSISWCTGFHTQILATNLLVMAIILC